MAQSSDKNSHGFERKMANKKIVMGITIERTVKFAKVAWT